MRRRDKENSKGGPRLGIVVLLSKVDLRILFTVDGLVMLTDLMRLLTLQKLKLQRHVATQALLETVRLKRHPDLRWTSSSIQLRRSTSTCMLMSTGKCYDEI